MARRLRISAHTGRSPCGERGLKYLFEGDDCGHDASLPVRGAWVEMLAAQPAADENVRRSPCGERGLKSNQARRGSGGLRVAPRAGSVG